MRVSEGMYAGESLDWTRCLCESILCVAGQARYVRGQGDGGGCSTTEPLELDDAGKVRKDRKRD